MNAVSGERLISFVERLEAVMAEISDRKDDVKVILAEAVAAGLSAKGVKFCAKVRAQKPQDFVEAEQLRDHYLHAIGMADEPPLFRMLDALSSDGLGHAELIDRFKTLVPTRGEIIVKLEGGAPMRLWRDEKGVAHAEEAKPPASPSPAAPRSPSSPSAMPRQSTPVPDVDADGAEELGRTAAVENKPIISNPFPFGDARRARFDVGWRKGAGNDGMGPGS